MNFHRQVCLELFCFKQNNTAFKIYSTAVKIRLVEFFHLSASIYIRSNAYYLSARNSAFALDLRSHCTRRLDVSTKRISDKEKFRSSTLEVVCIIRCLHFRQPFKKQIIISSPITTRTFLFYLKAFYYNVDECQQNCIITRN